MEKERKIKTLSLVALIVAVLGLTVAFAALSQTLTINGTASVDAAQWDVHIEDLERIRVVGSAEVLSEPVIGNDGKSIKNLQVSLKKPNDSVKYSWKHVNSGTIDAIATDEIINGITLSSLKDVEEGSAEHNAMMAKYAENLFPEADWDGDGVTTMEERIKTVENIRYSYESYDGFTLSAGKSHSDYVEILWSNGSTELPKGNVVMNIDFAFVYTQK